MACEDLGISTNFKTTTSTTDRDVHRESVDDAINTLRDTDFGSFDHSDFGSFSDPGDFGF